MTLQEQARLITRNAEEVIQADDVLSLIETKTHLKHYIGFEISGQIHIGTGLMCMSKVKDFMDAGVECSILLADWHTWLNDKLGGDMKLIQEIAVGYFKEGLKASLVALGGDPDRLKFVLGSDLYHNNDQYWQTVVEISKNITLARNLRSISIMGRGEGQNVDFAKLIYPPMQVADIFIQNLTIAHAGMDQRKAHVIMRDVALKLDISPVLDSNGKKIKPVAVHHHLLLGLQKPSVWPIPEDKLHDVWTSAKMSKSKPDSAVFIHDTPMDIERKVMNAFCPPDDTRFNPVLDWIEHLVFNLGRTPFVIKRKHEHGGDIGFDDYSELKKAYLDGALHSMDLKQALVEFLVDLLEPVRDHFQRSDNQRLLDRMVGLTITR